MEKNERQQSLLRAIVQEYIKTAHPVSSKILVEEYGFDYSSATIRNDMAALEGAGYIAQPYTSAGRVPTEKGYQYYIKHFIQGNELHAKKKETIDEALQLPRTINVSTAEHERAQMKHIAKTIAEMTGEAVVISIGDTHYYTGISHIFRKPEFAERAELMLALGEVFDQIDDVMVDVHKLLEEQIQVIIGELNPFSQSCAIILSGFHFGGVQQGVFGILGPMRMDYDTNIAICEYMETLIDEKHEQKK